MSSGFKIALSFEVGDAEKHHVDFTFNQFWGPLAILVDGQPVVGDLRILSLNLVKTYELTVGVTEKHAVKIEKTRPLFFAGFRSQIARAYVDGQLVAQDRSLGGSPVTAASS
jgi:hypothetical protein